MALITLGQAAAWCGGQVEPQYADVAFLGANNDTRILQPGQLFVALQGARDGHDFIPMAMERGAAAVLCSRKVGDYPAILVDDPRKALGDIAREERKRIGMQVVGVTGSVGKSTTKEMIACVLESKYRVAKTPANHNNDIGMPMAVLTMPENTEVAVLEMGMNHFGEMSYLTSIALPDVAVIVNIGTMHIENLGSREGILQAKLEILEGLKENGQIILNGDDALLWKVQKRPEGNITYFGAENEDAEIRGSQVAEMDGKLSFCVAGMSIELALEGKHFIPDALAAVAVGLKLGVEPEKIEESLRNFRNMAGRQEILEVKGYTIIKDCYNAGPESMAAALAVLGNRTGRRIAVLGDMLELGDCAGVEHYRVGTIAAKKAEVLLAYGPNSGQMVNGAKDSGMQAAQGFTDRGQLIGTLKEIAKPGDVLLFKGSRGMQMELAFEGFLKD